LLKIEQSQPRQTNKVSNIQLK